MQPRDKSKGPSKQPSLVTQKKIRLEDLPATIYDDGCLIVDDSVSREIILRITDHA